MTTSVGLAVARRGAVLLVPALAMAVCLLGACEWALGTGGLHDLATSDAGGSSPDSSSTDDDAGAEADGWPVPGNLLANGDFEITGSSGDVCAFWTINDDNVATPVSPGRTGQRSCQVCWQGEPQTPGIRQVVYLDAEAPLGVTLRAYVRRSAGSVYPAQVQAQLQITALDGSTPSLQPEGAVTADGWKFNYVQQMSAAAAGAPITVLILDDANYLHEDGGCFLVDDVSLTIN